MRCFSNIGWAKGGLKHLIGVSERTSHRSQIPSPSRGLRPSIRPRVALKPEWTLINIYRHALRIRCIDTYFRDREIAYRPNCNTCMHAECTSRQRASSVKEFQFGPGSGGPHIRWWIQFIHHTRWERSKILRRLTASRLLLSARRCLGGSQTGIPRGPCTRGHFQYVKDACEYT